MTTIELPAPAEPAGPAASAAPTASAAPSASPSAATDKVTGLETPPFVARFALVFRSGAPPSSAPTLFGEDSIRFFESPVTCDEGAIKELAPKHVSTGLAWRAGSKYTFQQLVFKDGRGMGFKGAFEVLSAPGSKGDMGRVRIEKVEGANVKGGDIDALVCE